MPFGALHEVRNLDASPGGHRHWLLVLDTEDATEAATGYLEKSKRLRQRFPELKIVVGLWNSNIPVKARDRLTSAGANAVVTTLSEALAQVH